MQTARKVAVADSRWRSFPLRGPLPFSGANAAFGYLPLQLALRPDVRMLKIRPGKRLFSGWLPVGWLLRMNERGG